MWEIEVGPDGLFDVLRTGRVIRTGLDAFDARRFFEVEGIELDDVEGADFLS